MRIPTFKKAKNIYYSNLVKKTGETQKNVYFEVEDPESGKEHMVTLTKTTKGLIFDCDCTNISLSTTKPVFCSHILAVVFHIYYKIKV